VDSNNSFKNTLETYPWLGDSLTEPPL